MPVSGRRCFTATAPLVLGRSGERQNQHDGVSDRASRDGASCCALGGSGPLFHEQSRRRTERARAGAHSKETGKRRARKDRSRLFTVSVSECSGNTARSWAFSRISVSSIDSDQTDILRQILRLIKIDDRKFDLDTILFEIGQAKSRFLSGRRGPRIFSERKTASARTTRSRRARPIRDIKSS